MIVLNRNKLQKLLPTLAETITKKYLVFKEDKDFFLVSKDVKQVRVENLRWRRIGLRLGSLHDSRIELTREAEALLAPSTQKVIPKSIKEQKGSLGYAKRHPV